MLHADLRPGAATTSPSLRPRVALLASPATYRAGAFLRAAERIDLDVMQVIDTPDALRSAVPCATVRLIDFTQTSAAVAELAAVHAAQPFAAVLALDDSATLLAATLARELGLPHNEPDAALAARDKWVMREALRKGGVPTPHYRLVPLLVDAPTLADDMAFPVVVKPTNLSGSRGVIRADNAAELAAAWERTRQIVQREGESLEQGHLLIEEYLPGVEVALEGLLTNGTLQTLALFDKPDPLEGPFFEETIYVTPSRLAPDVRATIAACTEASAAALGLREGPIHAELRINDAGVWLIEMAGRSIGGLCSTILEFGSGISLEELILRHAVGLALESASRGSDAVGVMMIPIPRAGMLRNVGGQDLAADVPGITGIEITAPLNQPISPLPEGASYLGFIFAQGETPQEVEAALRTAHAALTIQIDRTIPLTVVG